MSGGRLLFVYGSLRRGSETREAKKLARTACWIGRATTPGRLSAHLGYPMLVNGRGVVHGELFRLRDTARTLGWLDRYELCGMSDPRPHSYKRRLIHVDTPSARRQALAYVANRPASTLRPWAAAMGFRRNPCP